MNRKGAGEEGGKAVENTHRHPEEKKWEWREGETDELSVVSGGED